MSEFSIGKKMNKSCTLRAKLFFVCTEFDKSVNYEKKMQVENLP